MGVHEILLDGIATMGEAYVGAKGLPRGRSHAIRPWLDKDAYEGKDGAANETGDVFLANSWY